MGVKNSGDGDIDDGNCDDGAENDKRGQSRLAWQGGVKMK